MNLADVITQQLKKTDIDLIDLKLITPYYRNKAYILTTSTGKLCLHQHWTEKKEKDLLLEDEITNYLASDPKLAAIRTIYSFKHEEQFFTVKKWIDNRYNYKEWDRQLFRKIGESIGEIHFSLKNINSNNFPDKNLEERHINTDTPKDADIEKLLLNSNTDPAITKTIHEYLDLRNHLFRKRPEEIEFALPINKQLIHGDINLRNILIDKEKKIHIIDWEDAHLNEIHFDLAKALLYSCNYPETFDNAISFLSGYSSLYPLNREDIKHILEITWYKVAIDIVWIYSTLLHGQPSKRFEFLPSDISRINLFLKETNTDKHLNMIWKEINKE